MVHEAHIDRGQPIAEEASKLTNPLRMLPSACPRGRIPRPCPIPLEPLSEIPFQRQPNLCIPANRAFTMASRSDFFLREPQLPEGVILVLPPGLRRGGMPEFEAHAHVDGIADARWLDVVGVRIFLVNDLGGLGFEMRILVNFHMGLGQCEASSVLT